MAKNGRKNRNQTASPERTPSPSPPIGGNVAMTPHTGYRVLRGVSDPLSASANSYDNVHSPFFLHSGDHPGLSIVSHTLDGTNYNNWSIAMKMSLDAKNKLSFVDGSLPHPAVDDISFKIWSRCNSMVKAWLLNVVNQEIYDSILYYDDAAEMWNDLFLHFRVNNLPWKYQLEQAISCLQQGNLDLSTYYTKKKTLWEQLANAKSSIVKRCDCDHVKDSWKKLRQVDESQRLVGERSSPSLSPPAAFQIQAPLVEDQSTILLPKKAQTIGAANLATTQLQSPADHRVGDSASLSPSMSNDQIQSMIAYLSSKIKVSSVDPTPDKPWSSPSPSVPVISQISGTFLDLYSNSYYDMLVSSVSTEPAVYPRAWVIDSGATHHVTHNRSLYVDYRDLDQTFVKLPNGLTVRIVGIGFIQLTDAISLHEVLYIPEFKFNLISVSVLTKSLHSMVSFTSENWFIQDLTRELMIGQGSQVGNLYILDFNASDHSVSLKGIVAFHSCPETPEQNSVVERKHQHILNVARSLLFQSNVPLEYWGDCVLTVVFFINRLPSLVLGNLSPFEKLTSKIPEYHSLKSFGCLCYSSTSPKNRHKFNPRAKACVFLGYPSGFKGYKLLDMETHAVSISRHVIFHEDIFPLATSNIADVTKDFFPHFHNPAPIDDILHSASSSSDAHSPCDVSSSEIAIPSKSKSERTKKTPKHLHDFHCYNNTSTILYPIINYVSYSLLSEPYFSFIHTITTTFVPKKYLDSKAYEVWCDSMKLEIDAMIRTRTWSILSLPPNKKAIVSKWVFTIKLHSDGSLERHKSRIVAKGYTQQEGLDYEETFSPVAKFTSVRMLLLLAAKLNWFVGQVDISNAFLNGDLNEELYMKLPPGYAELTGEDLPPNAVCRLHKSIYGLK
ncbi:unnamed protein product [Microthlaspi erraticum]|uniref:Integrase catalytic domain-containing protein n=1 Tax=Microthlaspi erraticum TaxID=1685480 RepID=A0A6D2JIR9_9BRAS|nr:unnamed protein product [Microthlaspi erraticum]